MTGTDHLREGGAWAVDDGFILIAYGWIRKNIFKLKSLISRIVDSGYDLTTDLVFDATNEKAFEFKYSATMNNVNTSFTFL